MYELLLDGHCRSVALVVMAELTPDASRGTQLTYTEQHAFRALTGDGVSR